MAKNSVKGEFYEILTDPKHVGLACEIYNKFGKAEAHSRSQEDPVLVFLQRSENEEIVSTIREQFPGALETLVRRSLMQQIHEACQAKLRESSSWHVEAFNVGPESLSNRDWPGISIEPNGLQDEPHWSFYLQLEGFKFPMKFSHGITYSEKNGRPGKMSKALRTAVRDIEAQLAERALNIRESPASSWLAQSMKPYEPYTIGNDATVVAGIHDGSLAANITVEYMTLFDEWSERMTKLNFILKTLEV
jgi:hypothetical protein